MYVAGNVEISLEVFISEAKDDAQKQVALAINLAFWEFLATRPPGGGRWEGVVDVFMYSCACEKKN